MQMDIRLFKLIPIDSQPVGFGLHIAEGNLRAFAHPIAQLAGVTGQVSVSAFIFGNGLTNTITPTSGMLLAYLATAKVPYGEWVRFVIPLVGILALTSLAAIAVAVVMGL